jgi:hypothetical protein
LLRQRRIAGSRAFTPASRELYSGAAAPRETQETSDRDLAIVPAAYEEVTGNRWSKSDSETCADHRLDQIPVDITKTEGIIAVLTDMPENILDRITFYDIDSSPIEKRLYLREIKKDISYFRKSCDRAYLRIDISGLSAAEAVEKIRRSLNSFLSDKTTNKLSPKKN